MINKALKKKIIGKALLMSMLVSVLIYSCVEKNKLKVDVSDVKVDVPKVKRLEVDIFNTPAEKIKASIPELRKNYGSFFDLFYTQIIAGGNTRDTAVNFNMLRFAADQDMRTIFAESQKHFKDISQIETQLVEAFKHYKLYFPNKPIPKLYTCLTGFNSQIVVADSILAVSLDMYFGKKYPYYASMGFPEYKISKFSKEYIPSDCMKAIALTEFPNESNKGDLITEMIYQGQILYFLDAMMPDAADTLKMGFSQKELEWCVANETNIWAFFVSKNLLYTNKITDVKKYTDEGPFTSTISKESPARIGAWTGLQIVRRYMKENPKVTLEQLMNDKDAHKILNLSKYKPRK